MRFSLARQPVRSIMNLVLPGAEGLPAKLKIILAPLRDRIRVKSGINPLLLKWGTPSTFPRTKEEIVDVP